MTPYFYFENRPGGKWDLRYEPMGGMQVQITEQTRALSYFDCEQVVLTTGLPGLPKVVNSIPNTHIFGVRLPQPSIKYEAKGMVGLLASWGGGAILWSIKEKVKKEFAPFDIVQCHCSELACSFLPGPIIARMFNAPLVITIHCSALFTSHPNSFGESLFHPLARRAEKWALNRASQVFVLTDRMRRCYLDNNLVHDQKISVVPDGVDAGKFSHVDAEAVDSFINKYDLPRKKEIIAYIGRIAPEKGWETFVKAAYELRTLNAHFLVCGDGHQRRDFEYAVHQRGLDPFFTFTGFIEHKDIPKAMKAARMVILPSVHEELGGTILEAMACGTPIIAAHTGGIPDIITDKQNGLLFTPGDVNQLLKAIHAILDYPDLREKMIVKGKDTVAKGFTLEAIGAAAREHYAKILNPAKHIN